MEKTISTLQEKINVRASQKLLKFMHEQFVRDVNWMRAGTFGCPAKEIIMQFEVAEKYKYNSHVPTYEAVGQKAKEMYDFLLPSYIENETNEVLNSLDPGLFNDSE